jgi:tetratricopeptide (TPR) repeat protein
MICSVLLVRWIDTMRPPAEPNAIDESLYVDGKTAKRMSLGFSALVADWYWMRSLQYVGRKIVNAPENVPIYDLNQLNLKLLAPLLDTATTLDPEFLEPYGYAAMVLSAVDVQEAIRITKKGIEANPNVWRLYQHLGYIYWQQGDYQTASETYGRGAAIPGAPVWMQAMKAKMLADGGSRATAREIYTRMFEGSTEEKVKDMARGRLLQLDSLDQRDVLRKVLSGYQTRVGRCPSSWRELGHIFSAISVQVDSAGAPIDPTGVPYVLKTDTCNVELNPKSEIIRK